MNSPSQNSTTSADKSSPELEILSPPTDSDKTLRNALSTFARTFDDWSEQGVQTCLRFKSFQETVFKEEKALNAKILSLENDKLKEEIGRRAAEKKLEELQMELDDNTIRTKEHERICEDLLQQATQCESKISLQNKRFSEMFNRWKESQQLAPFMETWENGEGISEAESELQMLENNMAVLVKFGETMETAMKKEKVDNEKKISNLIDNMKKQALAMFSPNTQHPQTSARTATRPENETTATSHEPAITVTSHEPATTVTPVSKVQQGEKTKISTRSSTSTKRKLIASSSISSTNDDTVTQKRGRQSEPNNISCKQNPEAQAKGVDTDNDNLFTAFTTVRKKVKKDMASQDKARKS